MKPMPVTVISKSIHIERRHMPAHETTLEAMFLGPCDAPIRPSQYKPSQVALTEYLDVKPLASKLEPLAPVADGDATKLDTILANQKRISSQLRLITNLLVSALDDRDEDREL